MRCEECGTRIIERTATKENPYKYDLSGIKDLFLIGITVRYCPECKSATPIIPRIAELHELIAKGLVNKPTPLEGDELRFLRKYGGFPANKFAALLVVDPSHLSRIENGHYKSLSPPVDKLARALALAARDEEHLKDILLHEAGARIQAKRKQRKQRPLFQLVSNRWTAAA